MLGGLRLRWFGRLNEAGFVMAFFVPLRCYTVDFLALVYFFFLYDLGSGGF